LNGYCVSGFVLAMLGFLGTFFAYVTKILPLNERLLYWFGLFRNGAPILFILGIVFSFIGTIECRKHESFGGAGLGYAGIVLAAAAGAHWAISSFFI
jgi:hypothetical protein